MKKIGLYFGLALLLYFISILIRNDVFGYRLVINTALFLFYVFAVIYIERPSLLKIKKISR
jgi:hypothetical protein